MALATDETSRFRKTPEQLIFIPGIGEVETFGVWVRPRFLTEKLDERNIGQIVVTTAEQGRPDILARRVYGASRYDWILIAFNNARDVLNWPEPGTTVQFPLPQVIFNEFG